MNPKSLQKRQIGTNIFDMILLDIIVGAAVKDGLPTAERVLANYPPLPTNMVAPDYYHQEYVLAAMKEYSDQQNAALRERVKELESAIEESIEIFSSHLYLEHKVNGAWEELAKALKK